MVVLLLLLFLGVGLLVVVWVCFWWLFDCRLGCDVEEQADQRDPRERRGKKGLELIGHGLECTHDPGASYTLQPTNPFSQLGSASLGPSQHIPLSPRPPADDLNSALPQPRGFARRARRDPPYEHPLSPSDWRSRSSGPGPQRGPRAAMFQVAGWDGQPPSVRGRDRGRRPGGRPGAGSYTGSTSQPHGQPPPSPTRATDGRIGRRARGSQRRAVSGLLGSLACLFEGGVGAGGSSWGLEAETGARWLDPGPARRSITTTQSDQHAAKPDGRRSLAHGLADQPAGPIRAARC